MKNEDKLLEAKEKDKPKFVESVVNLCTKIRKKYRFIKCWQCFRVAVHINDFGLAKVEMTSRSDCLAILQSKLSNENKKFIVQCFYCRKTMRTKSRTQIPRKLCTRLARYSVFVFCTINKQTTHKQPNKMNKQKKVE